MLQDNDNGDVLMEDGTAEEEKVKHSTEQDQQPRQQLREKELTGESKGTDQTGISDKGHPKKDKK
jgi:hypothetical protein